METLLIFKTLRPSESSGEWLWHIWGAVDVIQATQLSHRSSESETYALIDWVNYHHTLSRFSTQHWQHKALAQKTFIKPVQRSDHLATSQLSIYKPVCLLRELISSPAANRPSESPPYRSNIFNNEPPL